MCLFESDPWKSSQILTVWPVTVRTDLLLNVVLHVTRRTVPPRSEWGQPQARPLIVAYTGFPSKSLSFPICPMGRMIVPRVVREGGPSREST